MLFYTQFVLNYFSVFFLVNNHSFVLFHMFRLIMMKVSVQIL